MAQVRAAKKCGEWSAGTAQGSLRNLPCVCRQMCVAAAVVATPGRKCNPGVLQPKMNSNKGSSYGVRCYRQATRLAFVRCCSVFFCQNGRRVLLVR